MKLIVDAQLPPCLAQTLRKSGYDAVAVREIGLQGAEDGEIWTYALEKNAAIITKDEDFSERLLQARISPVVVWIRVGNITNEALLRWFIPLLPVIFERIEFGDKLVEVR
ncbi:MAG: hypothetical protein C5B47_03150 [Verrucomicrobia bacterium]|nr:MAG: hypothetical protein C5B47_03150 [Verrucomicrobiota bacterium]